MTGDELDELGCNLLYGSTKRDKNMLLDGLHVISNVSDGARKKLWVQADNGAIYLYKQSKINSFGEFTYEHFSEYVAMLIGDVLNIPCCRIILGENDILSQVMWEEELQSFIELADEMSHSFHMSNLQTFNISTLLRSETNPYCQEVVLMLLFDALIGNSDRHPGNFMYNNVRGFYPLFDNGSSLCSYVRDCDVVEILRDKNRFLAMNTTKSKPVLRDTQRITHEKLVSLISKQYPTLYMSFCEKVALLDVDVLLTKVNVSSEHKEIVKRFLEFRKRWFCE